VTWTEPEGTGVKCLNSERKGGSFLVLQSDVAARGMIVEILSSLQLRRSKRWMSTTSIGLEELVGLVKGMAIPLVSLERRFITQPSGIHYRSTQNKIELHVDPHFKDFFGF